MKFTPRLLPLAVIAALLSLPAIANAQMNYQGRLTVSNGAPITGNQATVRFSLYDSETAGTKVWGDFDVNADLLEGRFNVVIGPNDSTGSSINEVFTQQLYLQITLFDDQDPPQPITPALPRQQILNAPYALGANNANHAKTADTATALSNGSGTSPLNVNFTTGNVGIGKAPSRKLDVDGDVFGSFIVRPNGSYQNGSIYSDNNYGMLFRSAQPSPALAAFSFANTNDVKLMTIDPDGDVGIGTTAPSARLHVNGSSAETAFRVQVDGNTKLVVDGNGGVAIGTFATPPSNGLRVEGGILEKGQQVTSGAEDLRLIRGIVNLNGSKRSGVGFDSTVSASIYTVTYQTAFASGDIPVVTANVLSTDGADLPGIIDSSTNTGFVIRFGAQNITRTRSVPFNFIVVGRP